MADNRQYTALEWVVKEINETLQESQRVLETYASDPQDITQLRFCQTLIHQVYGSLHMVGFHGAAMLAEEMESLVQVLLSNDVVSRAESLEVLMRGILQLPQYLEQVQRTRRDYPAVVLSLLNDLRSARGASLLSESTLFSPNLVYAHQIHGQPYPITQNGTEFKRLISKLRQMYQYAAISVIHQVNEKENLGYLRKVADRLQKILRGTKRYAVWEIAYAVIDGMDRNIIVMTTAVKNLLRELDDELKLLETAGVTALTSFSSDEFLKNLLFYVGSTDSSTEAIDRIKTLYQLDQLMPLAKVSEEQGDLSAVDSGTLRAVATAIREEFVQIKSALDDCLQQINTVEKLDFIQTAMQRVNDTLAILGVGELRQFVNRAVINLANLRHQSEAITHSQLSDLAEQIADIEVRLDAALMSGGSETGMQLDAAQTAVLDECRNGLEKSKDAIVDYIASQWDVDKLKSVPDHMREVRGSLVILSLEQAADILSSCILYIESQLIEKAIQPKWQQLDSLADVIASVDYYLEYMSAARENDETILAKAEAGLENLGVAKADVASIQAHQTQAASEEAAVVDEDMDDIDAEVVEIFLEEVEEIQETLSEFFPQWANDFSDINALTETRRAFHTLKGSGRMVKATAIGELAWSIENMLNRVMDKTIQPSDMQAALIERVLVILPDMLDAYQHHKQNPHHDLCEQYMAWGQALSRNETTPDMLQALSSAEMDNDEEAQDKEIDVQLWEIFSQEAETHLSVVNEYIEQMQQAQPFYAPPSDPMQRALHTLKGSAYMAELNPIAELMAPLEKFAKELRSYQVNIDDDIFQLIKDAVDYTEDALRQIADLNYPVIPKFDQFVARLDELRERSVGPLIRQKEAEKAQQKVDPAVLEVLMAEGMSLLLDADLAIQSWREQMPTVADWQPLKDELGTLSHGAERARLQWMADLSRALEMVYQKLIEGSVPAEPATWDTLLAGHTELMDIVDAIAAGQDLPQVNTDLLHQLSELEQLPTAAEENEPPSSDAQIIDSTLPDDDIELQEVSFDEWDNPPLADSHWSPADNSAETPTIKPETEPEPQWLSENIVDEPPTEASFEPAENTIDTIESENHLPSDESGHEVSTDTHDDIANYDVGENFDPDTAEIFLEEANELLEELDESIHDWQSGADSRETNESMQRALHTFKGGARLTGLMALGDVAHDFETFLINNINRDLEIDFFDRVHDYQDQLIHHIDQLTRYLNPNAAPLERADKSAPELAVPMEPLSEAESTVLTDPATEDSQDVGNNVLPFVGKPAGLSVLEQPMQQPQPSPRGGGAAAARRSQPQEVVKVAAELMEELVNLAGETSISRGRMEEQISELGFSLEEMGSTVQRLQEQLRRLDIETEAQVLFRQEQMAEMEDFDPLEMDRYSQLQQLSRSLIESASDLMDLKNTLTNRTRDAETVLLQQSRINTDLQEGLMRSRMVPFSRIVPRLRRIVRQISTELDKDVDLELGNIEGELDRSMMERMVAPLEHMLRNAIDHGIEDVVTRDQHGKPAKGRILINLDRDGGDVLIQVADDGGGIDVNRVRAKAIERNLMNVDADLSDQEILQFILHAGFSTAETITQISGRGVGMDVVNSEIRQMGGSIAIDSRPGQGTSFTIRVPFTVSVNRALMITMGDDRYAIPLNTIEGIVRISPYELEHYYANPDEPFEYAGQAYQLRYLGTLLDHSTVPRLFGHTLPLPVLLVRSADHSVAIQVDYLQGSREIVVKSLGPQFRAVQGVSGATIMGDGHVVVILDLNALIRRSAARSLSYQIDVQSASEPQKAKQNPLVMVVDDSVTVRKVTSRLLERQGYDVITAKDGVDAMTVLQDHTPDIMLLDIEMPRMDGFEVAQNVRSSPQFNQLPIIMITSRTGEKHRQRGLESGANIYMGKPYQEEILLENIRELISVAESADV